MDCDMRKKIVEKDSLLYNGIESHLKNISECLKEYEFLYSSWRTEAKQLRKRLKVINKSYPSYSAHDATHSDKIVSHIELLLGKARIERLSPTDCWLILQCAYRHDASMRITVENIRKLVLLYTNGNEDIIKHLNSMKEGDEAEKKAAFFIDEDEDINSLVISTSNKFYEWPIVLRNHLLEFARSYYRKMHGTESRREIFKEAEKDTYSDIIPIRLRHVIGDIVETHTKDWKALMNLPYRENGFARDYIHPRFVAVLLWIGDLLDLDSNRYNPWQFDKENEPDTAKIHWIKHKSIEEFLVTPTKVCVKAKFNTDNDMANGAEESNATNSNDFVDTEKYNKLVLDACKEAQNWFNWIEYTLEKTAVNWNDIVPKDIDGGIASAGEFEIYLDEHKIDIEDIFFKYEINPRRSFELVKGAGFYDQNLVFLRELIQNSMDGIKLGLYNKLETVCLKNTDQKPPDVYNNDLIDFIEKYQKFLSNASIDIYIHIVKNTPPYSEKFKNDLSCFVVIEDTGKGISRQDLSKMKYIGAGMRPDVKDLINNLRDWLKPTGAFGIGMQAIFYHSYKFNVQTISSGDDDFSNMTIKHEIEFYSSRLGGEILNSERVIKKKQLTINEEKERKAKTALYSMTDGFEETLDQKELWQRIFDKKTKGTKISIDLSDALENIVTKNSYNMKIQGDVSPFAFQKKEQLFVALVKKYLSDLLFEDYIPIRLFEVISEQIKSEHPTKKYVSICRPIKEENTILNYVSHAQNDASQYFGYLLKDERADHWSNPFIWYDVQNCLLLKIMLTDKQNRNDIRLYYRGIRIFEHDFDQIPFFTIDLNIMEGMTSEWLLHTREKFKDEALVKLKEMLYVSLKNFIRFIMEQYFSNASSDKAADMSNGLIYLYRYYIFSKRMCRVDEAHHKSIIIECNKRFPKVFKMDMYEYYNDSIFLHEAFEIDVNEYFKEDVLLIEANNTMLDSKNTVENISLCKGETNKIIIFKDYFTQSPELSYKQVWFFRKALYNKLETIYTLSVRKNIPTIIDDVEYEKLLEYIFESMLDCRNYEYQPVVPANQHFSNIGLNQLPMKAVPVDLERYNLWIISPFTLSFLDKLYKIEKDENATGNGLLTSIIEKSDNLFSLMERAEEFINIHNEENKNYEYCINYTFENYCGVYSKNKENEAMIMQIIEKEYCLFFKKSYRSFKAAISNLTGEVL